MPSGRSLRVSHLVITLVAPKQNAQATMIIAPPLTVDTPGRKITRMPRKPRASATQRPRFMRSRRTATARIVPHTGVVNSMADTVARGSSVMPKIQNTCPAK
jgi:hypothetical protein